MGKIMIVMPKPIYVPRIIGGAYVSVNKNGNLYISYSATEFEDQTVGVDDQGNQRDPICP
jgi:hypothetical protein